ncbi:MAG: hypothetical protein OXF02_02225 [Simkaniaceae bacterium]|nr:hypothetical protein [Simkaniaceae bacterium]
MRSSGEHGVSPAPEIDETVQSVRGIGAHHMQYFRHGKCIPREGNKFFYVCPDQKPGSFPGEVADPTEPWERVTGLRAVCLPLSASKRTGKGYTVVPVIRHSADGYLETVLRDVSLRLFFFPALVTIRAGYGRAESPGGKRRKERRSVKSECVAVWPVGMAVVDVEAKKMGCRGVSYGRDKLAKLEDLTECYREYTRVMAKRRELLVEGAIGSIGLHGAVALLGRDRDHAFRNRAERCRTPLPTRLRRFDLSGYEESPSPSCGEGRKGM